MTETLTWEPEVTKGIVRLGAGALLVVDNPDAKIFEIDLNTKYAVADVYLDFGPEGMHPVAGGVLLSTNEHSLRPDPHRTNPTMLKWRFPSGEAWTVLADGPGRYTLTVVLYRRSLT